MRINKSFLSHTVSLLFIPCFKNNYMIITKYRLVGVCILCLFLMPAFAQVNYKITIMADPLVKMVNGNNVQGESAVRIKIYGDNEQTLLGGKLCVGDLTTIIIRDKPDIGGVIGLDIELTGRNWTNPVKINNINVKKETADGDEIKKFSFTCGCTLTPGNSLVKIDEAGALDFVEAEIAAPEFKLAGDFSKDDITFNAADKVKGEVSKTRAPKSEQVLGAPMPVPSPPNQICTEEKVQASSSFDINFIQNPNESNIFPGAMLYSEDIADGSYSSYASGSDLNPINLTTTIAIVGGNPTITVVDPDLGTINTAINDLLINQSKGEMEVQASFEVSEINSMEELTLKLGAHFNSATFDANLSADLAKSNHKSIKMVKFVQKYYTVTMVQPRKGTDLFKNKQKAQEAFESGKTPLYVNSITYGRVCYFFMQTDKSISDIKAHVDGEYKGSFNAGGSLDVTKKDELFTSNYSATIIGGNGANGMRAVDGYEGFMEMLRDGGTLDKSALALPISYSCKFLADNKQAFVNLYSSYTKRTCKPVKSDIVKAVLKIVKMTSLEQGESTASWGYLVEARTANNPNIFAEPFLISFQRGYFDNDRTNYVNLKKGDIHEMDLTSKTFEFNINDLRSGKQVLWISARVVEVDYTNILDPDDFSPLVQKTVMLREVVNLDMSGVPKESKLYVQFSEGKLEFTFMVEILE